MLTLASRLFVPILLFAYSALGAQESAQIPNSAISPQPSTTPGEPADGSTVEVGINGSTVLDYPSGIKRISIANSDIAEAVAVSASEVVVDGKAAGQTSLIVWNQKGVRAIFTVRVAANTSKADATRAELLREAGPDTSLDVQDGNVFLKGTVRDEITADRAVAIAATLGKVINLLSVKTPPAEQQVLLKVRFADVDRTASNQFGFNLFTMAPNGIGTSTTGLYGSPPTFTYENPGVSWNLSNLLNIFYYRPDINLGAVLQDLESRNLLQILAEPNLLTLSGKSASFLAGGEFPFPTIQGGASGVGQITIQFKEFGVRLNFLPTITPRGTIRLQVNPEVSSLDYSNGLTVSGYTVPGLSTRRVQTEIELQNGQSFVIAGLLNNQVTQQLSRMPGFADIPLFGKLFQSHTLTKSSSELLIVVTPELVGPIPQGVKLPQASDELPFLKGAPMTAPRTPGPETTGPLPPVMRRDVLPIEELKSLPHAGAAEQPQNPSGAAGFAPASFAPNAAASGTPVPAAGTSAAAPSGQTEQTPSNPNK